MISKIQYCLMDVDESRMSRFLTSDPDVVYFVFHRTVIAGSLVADLRRALFDWILCNTSRLNLHRWLDPCCNFMWV
jgi:hypothetical protein